MIIRVLFFHRWYLKEVRTESFPPKRVSFFSFMVPEFGLVIRFERLVDLNQSSVGSKGDRRTHETTNESSF